MSLKCESETYLGNTTARCWIRCYTLWVLCNPLLWRKARPSKVRWEIFLRVITTPCWVKSKGLLHETTINNFSNVLIIGLHRVVSVRYAYHFGDCFQFKSLTGTNMTTSQFTRGILNRNIIVLNDYSITLIALTIKVALLIKYNTALAYQTLFFRDTLYTTM